MPKKDPRNASDFPDVVHPYPGSARLVSAELVEYERARGIHLPEPETPLISIKASAERHGVSVPTVWRNIARGREARQANRASSKGSRRASA